MPAPVPIYNWTGIYIGGNVGGAFSGGRTSDSLGSNFTSTTSQSFLGGGQIGVNYEFFGGVVLGAEADFDWLPNTKNALTATAPGGSVATATINDQWLTLVDARIGYAFDRFLVYGKGGGAFAGTSNSSATIGGTSIYGISGPGSNSGWTAGAGVEWAFLGNWSVRADTISCG